MSRRIDPDRPLSDSDKEWLKQWSRHDEIFHHEVSLASRQEEAKREAAEQGFDEDLVDLVESLDVEGLKAELKKVDQPVSGPKGELQNRLLNALQDKRDEENQK